VAIHIGGVETESRGAGPKLVPPPAAPASAEATRELILNAPEPPEPARLPPAPRRAPRPPPPDILVQLAQYRPPPVHDSGAGAAPDAEPSPEEAEARRGRIEAVLRQVLAAEGAAFQPPGLLYQDFLVRLRIAEVAGAPPDLSAFRRMLATARAGISAEAAGGEAWRSAVARAEALPEDAQGVYLLLARVAMEGLPCPSDATIARAYGTYSVGRARRLLAWLEERKAIVCRAEGPRGGRRAVALVGLGWETAPGDPDGPLEEVAA
jgi:hypothetical protein